MAVVDDVIERVVQQLAEFEVLEPAYAVGPR
jgi:hypothetical protein